MSVLATFTRSGIAHTQDGTQVAANVPRYETGKFGKAILIEETATNLLFPSIPDAAATNGWLNGDAITSVTNNNGIAPDGTTTATRFVGLTGNSNASTGSSLRWLNGITAEGVYTFSFWAKGATAGEAVSLRFVISGAVLDTTIDCSATDGGDNLLTTGWRRYYATVTLPPNSANFYCILCFSGTIADKWLWRAQLQAGHLTNQVPTTTAQATRDNESLTTPATIFNADEGTVECWVRFDADISVGYSPILVSNYTGSPGPRLLIMRVYSTGKITCFDGDGATEITVSSPVTQVHRWYHVAYTWSLTERILYIDGVRVDSDPRTVPIALPNATVMLGHGYSTYRLNGLLEDLRISTRPLTAEEIADNYSSGAAATALGATTALFPFDNSLDGTPVHIHPSASWLAAAKRTPCEPVFYAAVESVEAISVRQRLASEWNAGVQSNVEVVATPGGGALVRNKTRLTTAFTPATVSTSPPKVSATFTLTTACFIRSITCQVKVDGGLNLYYLGLYPPPMYPVTASVQIVGSTPYQGQILMFRSNARGDVVPDMVHEIGGYSDTSAAPLAFDFDHGMLLQPDTYTLTIEPVNIYDPASSWISGSFVANAGNVVETVDQTGSLRTAPFDLGATANIDSRVSIDDTVTGGALLTYSIEGSDNNAAWTSLGDLVDGGMVPPYRYYRLTATFISSGYDTAELYSIRVVGGDRQYLNYGTHLNEPADLGAEVKPYLKSVSAQSSKIALRDKPTVGDLTLVLQWLRDTSALVMATGRKRSLTVYLGFVGLAASEYEPYFTGTWDSYTGNKDSREFTIKVRDVWKRFKKKVPDQQIKNGQLQPIELQFGQSPSNSGTPLNIIDAMTRVADLAQAPDRFIDRAAFATLKAASFASSEWNVFRVLTEQKDSEELLSELAITAGVFLVPQPDGKLAPVHYDTILAQTPAATFDAAQITFSELNPDTAQTVTRQMIYHNVRKDDKGKYLAGQDKNDFSNLYPTIEHPACIIAERDREEVIEMEWFDRWGLGSGQASGVPTALTKLADRFESWFTPIANVDGVDVATSQVNVRASNVPLRYYGIRPGMTVWVDNLRLPCPATAWEGFSDQVKFLVMSKSVDPKTFTLTFDLLQVGPLAYNATPTWYSYSQAEIYPPVTGLALSERLTRSPSGSIDTWLDVAFTIPTDFFNSAEIWSNADGGGWRYAGTVYPGGPSTQRLFTLAVQDGQTVQVAVLTVNAVGRRMAQQTAPQASRLIVGKAYPPGPPVAVTATVERNLIRLTITPPLDVDIASYVIRLGSSFGVGIDIGTIAYPQDTFLWQPNTSGDLQFWIKSKDTTGHISTDATAAPLLTISAPQFPVGSEIAPQVIDNNVLLKWPEAGGTYPVERYEVRKGATFATATLLGTLTATFNAFFETVSGTYKYWVAARDSAGLLGSPLSVYCTVNQPPDFVLRDQRALTWATGTRTNCAADVNGSLVAPINTSETYQAHFTSHSWSTPQDQVDAGYPIFIQPGVSTGQYVETIDYGATIANSKITLDLTRAVVAGTVTLTPTISVSLDNSSWTDYSNVYQVYATMFRYVKITLDFASSDSGIMQISASMLRLDLKQKTLSLSVNLPSTSGDGDQINFSDYGVSFIDVEAIAAGAPFLNDSSKDPVRVIYNFVDTANPTYFKGLAYDKSGNRVALTGSNKASFIIRGV